MSEQNVPEASAKLSLPDAPSLEWLRKEAKRRLAGLRHTQPQAKLADAQREVAGEHGFPSWRSLRTHVESLRIDGQLFGAAEKRGRRTTRVASRQASRKAARAIEAL